MPVLDTQGKIAAAVIGFYVPVAVITFALVVRYAFRRDAGWMFLFVFALIRIAGGALLVAAELVQPTNIDLFISAYVLESAGLSPLMLATIGFLGLVGQYAFSESPRMISMFRVLGLLALTALALSVAGGVESSNLEGSNNHTGMILRRVGAILFGVLYVIIFIFHLICWSYRYQILRHRRTLLYGITLALPFLGVRVAYAILSSWSSSDEFGNNPTNNTLAKFNMITGDWRIYLVMSLVMEFIVVLIYLLASTTVPLHKDGHF